MKTITFSIQKGGTGKTSISLSVAYELAKTKKVLFIDADPQGNSTAWLNVESVKKELADLLKSKNVPEFETIDEAVLETRIPNLYLIPTASIGGDLSNVKDTMSTKSPYFFADILDKVAEYFDYCIIDTSPSFTCLEKQVFIASDEIIPVLLLDKFSSDGSSIFAENLLQLKKEYRLQDKPHFTKLILNKRNNQKTISKKVLTLFEEAFGNMQLFIIPTEPNFEKAQFNNKFVQELSDTKKDTIQTIIEISNNL